MLNASEVMDVKQKCCQNDCKNRRQITNLILLEILFRQVLDGFGIIVAK